MKVFLISIIVILFGTVAFSSSNCERRVAARALDAAYQDSDDQYKCRVVREPNQVKPNTYYAVIYCSNNAYYKYLVATSISNNQCKVVGEPQRAN